MQTIISISRKDLWEAAQQAGQYTQSTIHQSLSDVGFIHCTNPDQTMSILPRFVDEKDVVLLFIDTKKVKAEIRFEAPKSGRQGLFPHIYGPLNTDAVHQVIELQKDAQGNFQTPPELKNPM